MADDAEEIVSFAKLSEVKKYLKTQSNDDDDVLKALLKRTTKMMQNYIGRDLIQATYTDEPYEGDGQTKDLMLKQYPLITLTAIKEITDFYSRAYLTLTEHLHYEIKDKGVTDNGGLITRIDGNWQKGIQNYLVTYTAGYSASTMPEDLKQAQIDWLTFIYNNADMRLGVASYRLGSFSVNFKDNEAKDNLGNSLGPALPPSDVRMILDNYREPRMEGSGDTSFGGLI